MSPNEAFVPDIVLHLPADWADYTVEHALAAFNGDPEAVARDMVRDARRYAQATTDSKSLKESA